MSNDKTPLQQCIESGQVSPAEIEAHRAAGDLDSGPVLVHVAGETRWVWPAVLAALKLPYEVVTEDILTNCPWCGTRGLDYDESDQPAVHCHHDEPPFSLARQMAEVRRAERKALDEALAPAREKMREHFFEMLTLATTRYHRVKPTAFGLPMDELKAYDNTEDVKMVSSDPDKEFRDQLFNRENRHLSYVKTALHRIAQELGITVEQLRAQAGKPIAYKGGTLYLIPRTSHTSPRPNTEPLEIEFFTAPLGAEWDELDRGALAQHAENISGAVIDEVTIPKDQRKMCIQCGRKQEADGTLTCGH